MAVKIWYHKCHHLQILHKLRKIKKGLTLNKITKYPVLSAKIGSSFFKYVNPSSIARHLYNLPHTNADPTNKRQHQKALQSLSKQLISVREKYCRPLMPSRSNYCTFNIHGSKKKQKYK